MNWGKFAKILIQELPGAILTVENLQDKTGLQKWQVVQQKLIDEVKSHSEELANHPEVLATVKRANDATVAALNTISRVEAELEAEKKVLSS